MPAHRSFTMVLSGTILLLGCNGKTSNTLSRSTALQILQDKPDVIRGSGRVVFPVNAQLSMLTGTDADVMATNKHFIDDLVNAKFVTYEGQSKNLIGTDYFLKGIVQPNVEADNGVIAFVLATGTVKEVSGIRQDGPNAIADVIIASTPTGLYSRLHEVVKNDLAGCGDPKVRLFEWPCAFPDEASLSETRTRQFRFTRFDDGWRLLE